MYRARFKTLLAGNPRELARWTSEPGSGWPLACAVVFAASCAMYGATFGLWRSEVQSLFTAIKFPLVVLLTCASNALLNGCLALVMGAGMSFRQSSLAILMCFTIMGLVLAAFAPLMCTGTCLRSTTRMRKQAGRSRCFRMWDLSHLQVSWVITACGMKIPTQLLS